MKYLVDTITEYVAKEAGAERTVRFVLPSYPSGLLLPLGLQLEERFSRVTEYRVKFVYGIAYRLGEEWRRSDSADERAAYETVRSKGWYNEGNNLTSIRNRVRDPNTEDSLVILIAGYDHIDDRASLRDFFHLDQQSVWMNCLKHSFMAWVEARLRDVVDVEDSPSDIARIAETLRALYEQGLADLPGISRYLGGLDLTGVSTGREAEKAALGNLAAFHLPQMKGLLRDRSRKTFAKYLGPAQEFFNYSTFLEASARQKAKKSIDGFAAANQDDQLDEEVLGGFQSLDDLLGALRHYVDDQSEADRQRLLTADFTYILDKILGYRIRTQRQRVAAKKLRGLPPEVFLRAIWLTLNEYAQDARVRSVLPEEDLSRITLRSLLFRHDFDAGDDEGSGTQDDHQLAQAFLQKVLGGVDGLLEQHVYMDLEQDRDAVEVHSHLCPSAQNDLPEYQKLGTAEPTLKFEVEVSCVGGQTLKQEFLWCLSQNHQSRLLVDLGDWARAGFQQAGNALPVLATPYVPEVFLARDEEEVDRLLGVALNSENRQFIDLLQAPGMDPADPLMNPLRELSFRYQAFLSKFDQAGFFTALDSAYDDLRLAYAAACQSFLQSSQESCLGPLLCKAFTLVDAQSATEPNWEWSPKLESAVATPLHPAVLDMLRHQHSFLCESFSIYGRDGLKELGSRRFAEKSWNKVVDLARVQRPLFGTLKDTNAALDSGVRSYGYVHLIGECRRPLTSVHSRLLLDYDSEEDEELTETELFRETRASQLVRNILLDYRKLHAHADDGLSIGAYCGGEIQPVIAGIDKYLEDILPERGDRPYGLQVTVFSGSRDDSSVTRWLDAWRERWQDIDLSSAKRHYSRCRIAIAYRVVSEEGRYKQFARLLQRTALDVMFFTDFIRANDSRFEVVREEYFPDDGYRKFPVLEKAVCAMTGGGMGLKRDRVLSQRRFTAATLHMEVMARLSKGPLDPAQRHVIVGSSDFQPWDEVIGAAHEHSAWVVCVDPAIDELLLRKTMPGGAKAREIIGFGTGVGAHGENNYTISTEQYAMADVRKRIGSQLSARLGPWEAAICEQVAGSLVAEASNMAGLSVVRATGPSEYVRDYIAYATVRKLLRKDSQAFCDELVSLDAFRHWFDDGEERLRPDLLRLRVKIVEGYFAIEAQIIECKLAQWSDSYLAEARDQVSAGLRRLIGYFRPREEGQPVGIGDRPDQRYWWMQFHRLIASRGKTTRPLYADTLTAFERLSEGYFSVTWQGAVFAIWTDKGGDSLTQENEWTIGQEGRALQIRAYTAGGKLVRRVCLEGATTDPFATLPGITLSFRPIARSTAGGGNITKNEGDDRSGTAITEPKDSAIPEMPMEHRPSLDNEEPKKGEKASSGPLKVHSPARILLGNATAGNKEVFWEFGHPDLPNRHILVFGASGTGKTYTIQALLCELGKMGQNTLIVDYTNGFTSSQLEAIVRDKLKPQQHAVRVKPLPINPFRQQADFIDDLTLDEDPTITAQRVRGVFAEVYQLGDQQKAALYSAIRDGVSSEGANFDLARMIARLEDLRAEGGTVGSSAASVISKIQPFVDMKPFGQEDPESWERLFTDEESRCHIIQLAGFSKDMARLITEFALIDLYRYYRTKGSQDNPRVVVLDEIQNLDHRLESPIGQLLTEGRKFGISLILATQTLSNLDKDERDRLFQASHKVFFKPADTELKSFAQILESATDEKADEWVRRLAALGRGDCYSLGPTRNESTGALDMKRYTKTHIKALGERF